MATIQNDSFLTLHYALRSLQNVDIINTFNDKPATLSLGTGQLAPELEGLLIGLAEGTRKTFDVPAGVAFGEHNPDLQKWVAKSLLARLGDKDQTHQVGDVVQFPTPDGKATYAGAVQQVSEDGVLFDFNHPLAGEPLRFEVQILGVL